jgi:hypothetical protein
LACRWPPTTSLREFRQQQQHRQQGHRG